MQGGKNWIQVSRVLPNRWRCDSDATAAWRSGVGYECYCLDFAIYDFLPSGWITLYVPRPLTRRRLRTCPMTGCARRGGFRSE